MIIRLALIIATILVGLLVWLSFATTGYPKALRPHTSSPPAILIDNVRILSMRPHAPRVQTGMAVLVVGDAIQKIGSTGSLEGPVGTLKVDGTGKTLLPGLIDAHVHLWDEAELAAYLAHGVTTIRNMSGMPFHLSLSQRIRDHDILGPDLITTGPILNGQGVNTQDNHQIVATAKEGRSAVRKQYERGYRILKIYSNLNLETYEAIRDEAALLDMTLVGHTPEGVRGPGVPQEHPFDISYDEVLDDGFQTLEHLETIVWHGLRDELDEAKMQDLAEDIRASGSVVTPTLIAHASLVRTATSKGVYLQRQGVEALNPLIQRFNSGYNSFWSSAPQELVNREERRSAFYLKAAAILNDADVPMITGTDAGVFTIIPGSSMTRELELLVQAGLTPYEALQAATVIAGPAIGLPDRGQIAPGFRANLILVPVDPLNDVSIMESPEAVMVGGVWLNKADLRDLREASNRGSTLRAARRLIEAWFAQR